MDEHKHSVLRSARFWSGIGLLAAVVALVVAGRVFPAVADLYAYLNTEYTGWWILALLIVAAAARMLVRVFRS